MKRLLGLCAFIFATVQIHAATAQFSGKVEGRIVLETINVTSLTTRTGEFVTTVPIALDNSFSIEFELEKPTYYRLDFKNSTGVATQLFLGVKPGDKIRATLSTDRGMLHIVSAEGSDDIRLLMEHKLIELSGLTKLTELQTAYAQTSDAAERSALQSQYMDVYAGNLLSCDSLLTANASVFTAGLLAYSDFGRNFHNHRDVFEAIDSNIYKTNEDNPILADIHARLQDPIAIGNMAPELMGKDPDGNTLKLSDLRGKVVLVDFWASWCGPCRAENPTVVEAYKKYADKGFEVFGVSLDSDAAAWKSAIAADGLVWKNHISSLQRWGCPLAKTYGVSAIPFSVLVGRDGKIIAVNLRGANLLNRLELLFE